MFKLKKRETFYQYNFNETEETERSSRLYSYSYKQQHQSPSHVTAKPCKFTHNPELILSSLRYDYNHARERNYFDRWHSILSSLSKDKLKTNVVSFRLTTKVWEQVRLDVDRAFCFDSEELLDRVDNRNRLYDIIIKVLQQNSDFNYYQGFHEICSVFFIIFKKNEDLTIQAIHSFSNMFLSPFLHSNSLNFEKILSDFTEATISIATEFSWKMGRIKPASSTEITALNQIFNGIKEEIDLHGLIASWFLTWFVHEFTNFNDIIRIFDFELYEIRSNLAPIYIATSIFICEKEGLFSWTGGCFELMMHIRTLPKNSDIAKICECARKLLKILPPEQILRQFPNFQRTMKKKNKKKHKNRSIFAFSHFGLQFWLIILLLHGLYFILSSTIWPFLKNY